MQILTIPNPILYTRAQEVTEWAEIPSLVDAMIETATGEKLLGLAANQVGILKRVMIVDLAHGTTERPDYMAFINPVITPLKEFGRKFEFEGCASIQGRAYMVERWNKVFVTAQDITGENFSMKFSVATSRAIQHELDHLNGITINRKKFREMRIVK